MNYNEPSIKKKREELSSPKKRRRTTASAVAFRVILFLICAICVSGAGLAYGSFKGIIASAPKNVSLSPKYSSTIIYDDNNKAVQPLHDYSSNRIKVKSEELPDNLKNAFIAIEDERFYEHDGVNILSTMKAAVLLVKSRLFHEKISRGGSTITQQLARKIYLTDDKTYERKVREIFYAMKLAVKVISLQRLNERFRNSILQLMQKKQSRKKRFLPTT